MILDAALALLAALGGAIAAVTGFGLGSLLTPVLSVIVGTKAAVAIVAIPHIAATTLRLWLLRDSVDRSVLIRFGLPCAAGGLLGGLLYALVSSPLLGIVLGVLLIVAGLSELSGAGARLRLPAGWAVAAGVLSGLFGGLVGNQGGIRSAALLRFDLRPTALIATGTASALIVDVARLPVYLAASGPDILASLSTVVAMTVGALVGTVAGAPIVRRLPQADFRRYLAVLLVGLGIALVLGIGR